MKRSDSSRTLLLAALAAIGSSTAHAAVVDQTVFDPVYIKATASAYNGIGGLSTDEATGISAGQLHAAVSAVRQMPDAPASPLVTETATGTIDYVNAFNAATPYVTASGVLSSSALSSGCSTCGAAGTGEVKFAVQFKSDVDTNYHLAFGFPGATVVGDSAFTDILANLKLVDLTTSSTTLSTGYLNEADQNLGYPLDYDYFGTVLANHLYRFEYLLQTANAAADERVDTGYYVSFDFAPAPAPVPLPAAAWLLISGVGMLVPVMRRRRASSLI